MTVRIAVIHYSATGNLYRLASALADEPELVNSDAEKGGWLFRIKLSDPGELVKLMDKAAYDSYVAGL